MSSPIAQGLTRELAQKRLIEFQQTFGRESDRGFAVLSMCVIEDLLRELVRRRLGEFEGEMFGLLAPTGRWKSLCSSAYMLGLITKTEKKDLEILVTVRNKFAHRATDNLSFEQPEIRDQLSHLYLLGPEYPGHDMDTQRNKFLIAVIYLHVTIGSRLDAVEVLTPRPPESWIDVGDD